MVCPRCGTENPENAAFCQQCGEIVSSAPFEGQSASAPSAPEAPHEPPASSAVPPPPYAQQPQPQMPPPPIHPPYGYGMPPMEPAEKPTSVWAWLGMFLLEYFVGIGHLILMIVFAVSGSTAKHLQNYARAKLIMALISVVLSVVGFILFFVFFMYMNDLLLTYDTTYPM